MSINVLVYSGPGATVDSIKCCTDTLRQLLSPNYCILNVGAAVICNEPWASSTALLAIPGGADLPYCKELDGKGTKAIENFVRKGGSYIGFCAGGYFGSSRVEFDLGSKQEVMGSRELKFFPGTCAGPVYPGFEYGKDTGVVAAVVKLQNGKTFKSYFNGGGCFKDAKNKDNCDVLAEYDNGEAAVVHCKVGKGNAVLTGIHPEFTLSALKDEKSPTKTHVLKTLEACEPERLCFMRECLTKLGLKVGAGEKPPLISRLNLTSLYPERLRYLVDKIGIKHVGANDTFDFFDASKDGIMQGDDKEVDVYYNELPDHKLTPYFNHDLYYETYKNETSNQKGEIGSTLMYGEVVTSTSTMLDKNISLLRDLPHGFALVGSVQVEGRGRGSNAWVNPKGVLPVSTVLKIPVKSGSDFPLVFIQYLVPLAMVEAIKGYSGSRYSDIPVRLKWPNDIYAGWKDGKYIKIGGLLVNTNYFDGQFTLVCGLGVNVANEAPSTSLNLLVDEMNKRNNNNLEHYKIEVLLAKFMAVFEKMYNTFLYTGFQEFESVYYKRWLHQDQIVTLEQYGNTKAKIKGISTNAGLLIAEEVELVRDTTDVYKPTGKTFELQPDGNSFDMFRGLLKKKS